MGIYLPGIVMKGKSLTLHNAIGVCRNSERPEYDTGGKYITIAPAHQGFAV